ncbi:xaa-Pro aminopeptidase 1-like [Asterias rubens]|uniref:xaa-Pro aminopeptidase 1-like n=1 Tax=Asterias rubens TaxID=7604 RepID=UPI0014559D6B|nr:xaa-Pro aminopeptidase 1-like [Asterias rubens]
MQNPDYRNCDVSPPVYPATTVDTTARLAALRVEMAKPENNFDAYLIPSEDAHGSEDVPEHDTRRTYICGLSGSAGYVIVTLTEAYIWTDGRYFVQAERELDCNWTLMKQAELGVLYPDDWMAKNLQNGSRIGFDPTLISASDYLNYQNVFANEKGKVLYLVSQTTNLVDTIWAADTPPQPSYPTDLLMILDATTYTGETWKEKIFQFPGDQSVRGLMKSLTPDVADVLVISALDEIAWLFNLRGKDVPNNPMFISYCIITSDEIKLYLNDKDKRATSEIMSHLEASGCSGSECTQVYPYSQFLTDLQTHGEASDDGKIWISDASSYAIYERVPEEKRIMSQSPVMLMKAVKSTKEIEGMKRAHLKDSIALAELGGWLQQSFDALDDPAVGSDSFTELDAQKKAREVRQDDPEFASLSFGTITGFGANAAVIHYSSSEETNVRITDKSTLLLDSGSQYYSGTTDITRTFHFGSPTAFTKEAYTRVLMGHIDLVTSHFRSGVYGRDLDTITRNPLWINGLDYRHGTGHGIGSFLNVHEGPARISLGYSSRERPIQIGMFFSDEPGYYEDGEFGIRLENVMMSVAAKTEHQFSTYQYMTFEMVSLIPFEPNLIDFSLLTPRQLDYYNDYNKRIREEVGPSLKSELARNWMTKKTEPVLYTFRLGADDQCTGGASQVAVGGICLLSLAYAVCVAFLGKY